MTKVMQTCTVCNGRGNVPAVRRALQADEIRDPNDLENFKIVDLCASCDGSGKRGYEVE